MIACCGEALMDMVPYGDRPDAFLACPGGCPYNTAIAAARLGAEVSFLGRLGTDFLGTRLYDRLVANRVDASSVARSDQAATLAFVSRSASGDARYAFYSEGAADRSLVAADLPPRLPPKARFLMIGSISMLQEPIASTVEALAARERGRLLVSFDPNIRPSLIEGRSKYVNRFQRWASLSAVIKISSDDLGWLYPGSTPETAIDILRSLGPELVVVTLGREGSIAGHSRATARAEGFPVKVIDTIGAGDTFHAALLYLLDREGIATRADIRDLDAERLGRILRFANAAAAADCTRAGAEPPGLAEVEGYLKA
jgi:fructokinase